MGHLELPSHSRICSTSINWATIRSQAGVRSPVVTTTMFFSLGVFGRYSDIRLKETKSTHLYLQFVIHAISVRVQPGREKPLSEYRAEGIECRGFVTGMSDGNAEKSGTVKEPRDCQQQEDYQ